MPSGPVACEEPHLRQAIIVILAAFHIHSASAASTELDDKLQKQAAETQNAAVVFMEIEVLPKNGPPCGGGIFARVKAGEGKPTSIYARSGAGLFGNSISFHGGAAVLPSGTYTFVNFECSGSRTFKGPVASFLLRPGEVINAGRLVLEYELVFFGKINFSLAVRDLSPEAVASLSSRAPIAFSRAKKRYMTLNSRKPVQAAPPSRIGSKKQ